MKLLRPHVRALVKSMNTRRTLGGFILASTAFVLIAIIPGRSPAMAATSAPSHSPTALGRLNTAPYATNASAAHAIDASQRPLPETPT